MADECLEALLHNERFRQKVSGYFGAPLSDKLEITRIGGGTAKTVYKIFDPEHGKAFMVKEIRFQRNEAGYLGNGMMAPDEAVYELDTIREITKKRGESRYFPKPIETFSYLHPERDSYTEELLEQGRFVRPGTVRDAIEDDRAGSFFIVQECVEGRKPNADELLQAEAIRRAGIERAPRVWITVDTNDDDIIVRDDGSLVFVDVGNFKDLSPAESAAVDGFMAGGQAR